jgi:hypothetical protein
MRNAIKELADFIDNMDGEISLAIAVLFVILWFAFVAFHGYYAKEK